MVYKLNEYETNLINEIEDITLTDYEIDKNEIRVDCIISALEDMKIEYDNLLEKYKEYQEKQENDDWEDNYE